MTLSELRRLGLRASQQWQLGSTRTQTPALSLLRYNCPNAGAICWMWVDVFLLGELTTMYMCNTDVWKRGQNRQHAVILQLNMTRYNRKHEPGANKIQPVE